MEEMWGRRAFLGSVATVTVGLSGCASQVGDTLGGGGRFDHGSADYVSALPAPEADGIGYNAFVETPIESESDRPDGYEFSLSELVSESISVSEVTSRVSFGSVSVLSGTFDPDGVAEALDESEGMNRLEPKSGYQRYESDDGWIAYGIGNPLVLASSVTSGGGKVMPQVNDIIEAVTDGTDTFSDTLPSIATTARAVGSPTLGSFQPSQNLELDNPESGVFPGKEAEGIARTVRGDRTTVSHVLAFEGEDAVPVEGLRTWVENKDGEREQFEHYDDVSYHQEGILGIIDASVPTEELRF